MNTKIDSINLTNGMKKRIFAAIKRESLSPMEIAEQSGLSIETIACSVKEYLKITDPDISINEVLELFNQRLQSKSAQAPPLSSCIPRRSQLCWDCVNAVPDEKHGCPWSNFFLPVEGWQAEKTSNSYNIISCPLFEHD